MSDLIDRQKAINVIERMRAYIGHNMERAVGAAFIEILDDVGEDIGRLPSAQSEIVKCKNCKHWVPGYITDNDDFISPKCGKWQQMVGHSSDDYCSFADMRGEQDG